MATITLVTGLPGSGKTALVVSMLMDIKDRPLFVMGIPELKLDHNVCPPVSDWTEYRTSPEDPSIKLAYFTFPPNSVVVLDEAQRIYRPRGVGSKVPPEVASFETFRHTGIDWILLTQHANLLDSNIRKLIGRHIHIRCTALGKYRYEWPELGDPESSNSRNTAARERFKPPVRAFANYKSSELHTVTKIKKPWYIYLFAIAMVVFVLLGWQIYRRITTKVVPVELQQGQSGQSLVASKPKGPMTVGEYVEREQARIVGMPWTAPVYDRLTEPTEAPYPAGCVQTKSKCTCYTQQATVFDTTGEICKQIVARGIFHSWQPVSYKDRSRIDDKVPPAIDRPTPRHEALGDRLPASGVVSVASSP